MSKTQEGRSDEELMLAYQAGDSIAFETLYQRHSGKVVSFLRRRLDRREEVDEVFQQTWIKLHRSRDNYDSAYAFTQWLFVITKTVLLDYWSKENRRLDQPARELQEDFEVPDTREATDLPILEPGLATLAALPTDQRQAVEWRVIDELSYQEIAQRLNRSQESIRQMVSRALKKIRSSVLKSSPKDQDLGKK